VTGKDIQNDLIARLTPMMADGLIHREWSIRAGADDVFADVDAYRPIPILAVRPVLMRATRETT
jgi:hypothetical protein